MDCYSETRINFVIILYISTRLQVLLVYLLVNSILLVIVHLQMLYGELEDAKSGELGTQVKELINQSSTRGLHNSQTNPTLMMAPDLSGLLAATRYFLSQKF